MIFDFTKLALRRQPPRPESSPTPVEGALLGHTREGASVVLPKPNVDANGHALVLGQSGCGKSVMFAKALLDEYLASGRQGGDRECLVMVDAKGDLIAAFVAGLCQVAPQLLDNICYCNPFDQGFAFNLCKLQSCTPVEIRGAQLASLVATVSTATGAQRGTGGAGARQLDVLQNVFTATLSAQHPAANLTWAVDALTDPHGFKKLSRFSGNARAKAFLESTELSAELQTSCAARVRSSLAASQKLEAVVGSLTCLDLDDLLAAGRIVLLDIGAPPGGLESVQNLWANVVVRLVVEKILERRSPYRGHAVRLAVDEAQIVAPVLGDIATRALTVGRSKGLALALASQGTVLLDAASPTLLSVILSNTATIVTGRLNQTDANLLARDYAVPKLGTDESVSAVRARFAATACSLLPREFVQLGNSGRRRFRSRDVDLAGQEAARSQWAAKVRDVFNKLALPIDDRPPVSLAEVANWRSDGNRRGPDSAPSPRRSKWG